MEIDLGRARDSLVVEMSPLVVVGSVVVVTSSSSSSPLESSSSSSDSPSSVSPSSSSSSLSSSLSNDSSSSSDSSSSEDSASLLFLFSSFSVFFSSLLFSDKGSFSLEEPLLKSCLLLSLKERGLGLASTSFVPLSWLARSALSSEPTCLPDKLFRIERFFVKEDNGFSFSVLAFSVSVFVSSLLFCTSSLSVFVLFFFSDF